MKRTRKLIAKNIDYIDPLECDSTVGYTITRGRRLSANVNLTDCNRHITWYFNADKSAIPKIDRAISLLTEFKDEFKAAMARNRKPRKRRKAGRVIRVTRLPGNAARRR